MDAIREYLVTLNALGYLVFTRPFGRGDDVTTLAILATNHWQPNRIINFDVGGELKTVALFEQVDDQQEPTLSLKEALIEPRPTDVVSLIVTEPEQSPTSLGALHAAGYKLKLDFQVKTDTGVKTVGIFKLET